MEHSVAQSVPFRLCRGPRALPERIATVRALLADQPKPVQVEEIARRFRRNPRDDVREVLAALVGPGLARRVDGNRYAP